MFSTLPFSVVLITFIFVPYFSLSLGIRGVLAQLGVCHVMH